MFMRWAVVVFASAVLLTSAGSAQAADVVACSDMAGRLSNEPSGTQKTVTIINESDSPLGFDRINAQGQPEKLTDVRSLRRYTVKLWANDVLTLSRGEACLCGLLLDTRIQQSAVIDAASTCTAGGAAPTGYFEPTASYKIRYALEHKVYVSPDVAPDIAQRMIDRLVAELTDMQTFMPSAAIDSLSHIVLWLEANTPEMSLATYYPRQSQTRIDINPEKYGGLAISRLMLDEIGTPKENLLLHELAHAYHDQVLSGRFKYPPVLEAYEAAKASGKYDNGIYIGESTGSPSYHMTNAAEYFAELTEAYFGTNDWYPSTREELKAFDPVGYAAVEEAWGLQ